MPNRSKEYTGRGLYFNSLPAVLPSPCNSYYVLIIFIVLLLPITVFSQVVGNVTDFRSGEPLIGANVSWQNYPNRGTQTDLAGRFQLTETIDDSLVVSYLGYRSRTVAVTDSLSVRLRAADFALGTVTVKAARLVASEFATEQLTRLDIYLNPNAKADVLLAVDALPASTNTEESANISLRGSSPTETGVFLNNVPLDDVVRFDQTNGIGQFSIFNTALMESINVFPSNPPLEFGHATAGVVALYTDDDLPLKTQNLSVNLVGVSGLISRPLNNKTGLTAYVNVNTHHGLEALNPNALPDLNGFRTVDAGCYFIHKFSAQTALKIFNFNLLERYDYQFQHPSYVGNFAQNKQRNLTIANLVRQGRIFRWEWNQSFNYTTGDYGAGNFAIHNRRLDYYGALQGAYFNTHWNVKMGVSTKWNRTVNRGHFPTLPYAFAPEHPSTAFASNEELNISEGFVYAKYQLNPTATQHRWTLGSGLRFQPPTDILPSALSGQLNLNYQPNTAHRFTLATGQYHKVLLPGVEGATWNQLRSRQVALDYQFSTNIWTLQAAVYQKQNRDRWRANAIRGAELFAAYRSSNLELSTSLATIQSTLADGEVSYPSPHDLSYFLRMLVKYKFGDNWTIGLLYKQRQGRYYQPILSATFDETYQVYQPQYASLAEGERLPDYHLLDANISRLLPTNFGSMIIYASANNVLDFNNVRGYRYNFDYSERTVERFGQRVIFFGMVLQW